MGVLQRHSNISMRVLLLFCLATMALSAPQGYAPAPPAYDEPALYTCSEGRLFQCELWSGGEEGWASSPGVLLRGPARQQAAEGGLLCQWGGWLCGRGQL